MSLRASLFEFRAIITVVLGIFALCYLGASLYVLSSQPEQIMSTGFGTARSPYSDALGPWLLGGLHALFGVEQINYIYRPTIGWFWGSIIALTHRVEFIPLVFLGLWVLMIFTFLMLWRSTNFGLMLTLWIGWLAINFKNSILPLSPISLTVDLASFVLTALGVFLIIHSVQRQKLMALPCVVGSLVLGISAAIRGPMIAGGVVFILCLFGIYRAGLKVIVFTSIAFLAPIVLDTLMQRYYHVYNNGLISLFCLYSDTAHTWNSECHTRFLELRPGPASIVADYFNFIVTGSGFSFLIDGFINRVERDVELFGTRAWGGLLVVLSLLSSWKISETIKNKTGRKEYWKDFGAHAVPVWSLFIFWSFFLATRYSAPSKPVLGLLLISGCSIIALKYKVSVSFSLILSYLAACVFLTSLGLGGYDRVALTFSFLLHLGALLLITHSLNETTGESKVETHPRSVTALSWLVVIMLAGLYTCWAWWPNAWRTQFSQEIEGRDAAVKISDDKVLDRSLYFTGRHVLIYTLSDNLPIGSVRTHIRLEDPTRAWNESFIRPNTFLEQ